MILVDSSVLIDYLRTRDAKLFGLMQLHGGAVCGAIRAEILCGAQNLGHRRRLVNALNALAQLPFPSKSGIRWATTWPSCGQAVSQCPSLTP